MRVLFRYQRVIKKKKEEEEEDKKKKLEKKNQKTKTKNEKEDIPHFDHRSLSDPLLIFLPTVLYLLLVHF